ncbi:hypothetical protein L9G15_07600 [Shewanella sp. A3A]|nr:hypothetical protein [Shewanella ferrihydritica]
MAVRYDEKIIYLIEILAIISELSLLLTEEEQSTIDSDIMPIANIAKRHVHLLDALPAT